MNKSEQYPGVCFTLQQYSWFLIVGSDSEVIFFKIIMPLLNDQETIHKILVMCMGNPSWCIICVSPIQAIGLRFSV